MPPRRGVVCLFLVYCILHLLACGRFQCGRHVSPICGAIKRLPQQQVMRKIKSRSGIMIFDNNRFDIMILQKREGAVCRATLWFVIAAAPVAVCENLAGSEYTMSWAFLQHREFGNDRTLAI